MNTNRQAATTATSTRKIALVAGIFYLLTFVSIPTLSLYEKVHEADYILGSGPDSSVIVGGLLEIIVALTGIATAVVLFAVLRRQNEVMALGLIASRIVEACTIFLGVAFLLAIVTLRKDGVGPEALPTSRALAALYDRIFLLGQSFMPAINDLLLGYMLYKSRLIPRALSMIGMVGAFPLVAGFLAIMFDVIERRSSLAGLSALLVALFEFSLGVYLVVKGFRSSPITSEPV